MLAPATPDRKVISSNGNSGERFSMGISEDALAMVMDQLAGLYSDQLTALLREYATNAVDAHISAGTKRPIEVTLPTRMDPVLRIRDYGVGLSLADLKEVYSQYGGSNKRHTNDQNGMLGFGCKSALAYADMFNVSSVKDGIRIHAMISKTEDLPEFTTIGDPTPTTESNGTVVEIPVSDYRDMNRLRDRARIVYSYFDEGLVLVDGNPIPSFDYHLKLTDDLYIVAVDRYSSETDKILMGNVAYPATINHGLTEGYKIVARVPIGAVEFTASRESLKVQKPSTKSTIARIEGAIRSTLTGVVQRDVDASKTPREALDAVKKWRSVLSPSAMPAQGALKYQGREVPSSLSAGPCPKNPDGSDNFIEAPHFTLVAHRSSARKDHQTVRYVQVDMLGDSTVWIENFGQSSFTPTVKRRMELWADNRWNNHNMRPPSHYVLTNGPAPDFWVDNVIDYEKDIKPLKLPTNVSRGWTSGRPKRSYTAYVAGNKQAIQADQIDTSEKLFWVNGNEWDGERYVHVLTANWPKCTIVYMPSNRIEKFVRDFPMAERCSDGAKVAWAAFKASLSPRTLKALAFTKAGYVRSVDALDPKRISDPDLKDAIALSKVDVSKAQEGQHAFYGLSINTDDLDLPIANPPLAKYPLVANMLNGYARHNINRDHLYVYIEAAYRAYKSGVLK